MKAAHRRAHRALWPALALVVGLGITLALILRPPIPIEPPAAQGSRP